MPQWLDTWIFHSINISIFEAEMREKEQEYRCIAVNHLLLPLVINCAIIAG